MLNVIKILNVSPSSPIHFEVRGNYSDLGYDKPPTIVSTTDQFLLGLMDMTVDYGNSRIIAPLSSSASGV